MNFKNRSQSQKKLLRLQKINFQKQAVNLRRQNSNRNKFNQILHGQKSRKKILSHVEQRKIVNVGNFLQPTKIISVTAQKWVIFDYYSSKYIRGYRAHDKCQLNVFSKLLVFCALFTLILKHKIDISRFQIIVTKGVLKMFSRHKIWLCSDDILSLEDIMHLMVLQESEIYEVILSVNIGAYLYKKHKNQYFSVYDSNDTYLKTHLSYFYEFVNHYCQLMKLQNIKYIESDPTLRKQNNFASVSDLAKISMECMKIQLFTQILNKGEYQAKAKFIDQQGHISTKFWTILNKSIDNNFIPYINICRNRQLNQFLNSHCALYYQEVNSQKRPILIVLFNCYSAKDREKDIQQIVEWYMVNQTSKKQKKGNQTLKRKIKTQVVLQQQIQNLLSKKIGQKLSPLEVNKSGLRINKKNPNLSYSLKTQN